MRPYERIGEIVKNNKGISCTCNQYFVSGFAMVDGAPKAFEFEMQYRDARATKQAVAERFGCSASQVLVNFELRKHKFTINSSYEDLVYILNNAGVSFTEKTGTESEK